MASRTGAQPDLFLGKVTMASVTRVWQGKAVQHPGMEQAVAWTASGSGDGAGGPSQDLMRRWSERASCLIGCGGRGRRRVVIRQEPTGAGPWSKHLTLISLFHLYTDRL